MNDTFLTTTDNPYNPFTQFDQWYTYDYDKGYMTCALVAKYIAYFCLTNKFW